MNQPGKPKPCADHKGQQFPSLRAMARCYGLSRVVLFRRLKNGWSVEDALTSKIIGPKRGVPARDHLGNTYISFRAMARAWGIAPTTFSSRINRLEWDIQKALETPTKKKQMEE